MKGKNSITENEKLSNKTSHNTIRCFLFSYTRITSHIVLKNDEKGCNNREQRLINVPREKFHNGKTLSVLSSVFC